MSLVGFLQRQRFRELVPVRGTRSRRRVLGLDQSRQSAERQSQRRRGRDRRIPDSDGLEHLRQFTQFDRQRLGLAYNLDFAISDTMELVADVFYNDMDEGQHGQQLFVNGNFGGRQVFRPYTVGTGQPSVLDSFDTEGSRESRQLRHRRSRATPMVCAVACSRRSAIRRHSIPISSFVSARAKSSSGSIRWVHADAERNSEAAHHRAADRYPVLPDHAGAGRCRSSARTSIRAPSRPR